MPSPRNNKEMAYWLTTNEVIPAIELHEMNAGSKWNNRFLPAGYAIYWQERPGGSGKPGPGKHLPLPVAALSVNLRSCSRLLENIVHGAARWCQHRS